MSLLRTAAALAALTLCALGAAPCTHAAEAAPPARAPSREADLHTLLQQGLSGTQVPALGAVWIRNGQVSHIAVHGRRAADAPDPVLPDDVWHLGSNGKAMTATLIARLIERGLLSWETPLERLLPDLADTMQPSYRSATLRDLMGHRAGLPPNIADEQIEAFFADSRPLREQRADYARKALAQPPVHAVGSAELYSNSGFLIAGRIAEQVTGLSYEALMQREIFTPLGMSRAGFGPTRRGQALGHVKGAPVEGPKSDVPLVLAPAGGLHMPLQDWSKFVLDQLAGARGAGRLLTPASYAELQGKPAEGRKFAMGWRWQESMAGVAGPFIAHTGSNEAWFALVTLRPGSGDAVLVTSNAAPDVQADATVRKVAIQLLKSF